MVEVLAIDGPASVGKSSMARVISKKFNAPILHSGILYRKIALLIVQNKIKVSDKKKVLACIKAIDKKEFQTSDLYTSIIDNVSSNISAKRYVRDELMKYQRNFPEKFGKNKKFVIIEGRDIGTVIFPDAKYKIFMWADAKIRSERRYNQIRKKGQKTSLKRIYREIIARDTKDLGRKIAPLKPATNSVLLDTTYLDIEQSFNAIKKILKL